MSIVKSSVLNLYDSLTGDKHYQQKVSSDRVDLQTTTLPLNLKGTSINLSNEGGQQVSDIVSTTLSIIQSVVDETNARVSAVSAEASTRASSDATLQTAIDNEVANRIQAIIDESAIRLAAETVISNALTAEVAARQAAITSEITARSTADTNLQTNIDAEATSRISADNTLQANLTQEVSDRIADVNAEETARLAQGVSLQQNIDAEASTRLASDTTLQANLDAEISARASAVSGEATARIAADDALSASISAEQTARLAEVLVERQRIDALLAGSSLDLDSLKELVTAYTTSDANILSQIAGINTSITALQAQLDGTDAVVATLIANINTTVAIMNPEYPVSALTDNTRLVSSASTSGYQPYLMFDKNYNNSDFGWISDHTSPSTITVDGSAIGIHWVYYDLQPDTTTDVIKRVALSVYRDDLGRGIPSAVHVIGSNDASTWTSLYNTASVVYDTANFNSNAIASLSLSGNTTYYRYVGLVVVSTESIDASTSTAPNTRIQEIQFFTS